MRFAFFASLTAVLLLQPGLAHAQLRAKLQVSQVRVGFPAGSQDGEPSQLYKAGAWAPVYIDITVGPPGLKGTEGRIEVIVETADTDDIATKFTVSESLPELGPGGTFTVAAYTKPARFNSDITITLRHDHQSLGQPFKQPNPDGLGPSKALYLTVGSRMPGLRQAFQTAENQNNGKWNFNENAAFLDRIHQLPDRWFGYDGVDLIILATSKRNDFLMSLANPRQLRRREALADWVRRGGNLVVSAARNQDLLAQMPEIEEMLPVKLTKVESLPELVLALDGQGGMVAGGKRPAIEVAHLTPKLDRPFQTLLRRSRGDLDEEKGPALIVQGPYGLGRVTVVGFDLDQKPFADWDKQPQAWQWLLAHALVRENKNIDANSNLYGSIEILTQLQNYLENFEEIPVISFGWVALFILVYIIVVGPLDYFFLKKIVKRLELTWITFPTVVLTISAAAYFTAYWLKGNDLRIRKVDLVDIDLRQQQAVGHTWFTLFSPRIQHYTIGIEPAFSDGTPPLTEGADTPSVLISWMNRPEMEGRFGSRTRGQSLFRRSYDYEGAATGLRGVPIQVWSTKSFSASWQAPLRNMEPLVAATLRHLPNRPGALSGNITWRPGVANQENHQLQDTFLIYKGRAHRFPLTPGTPARVDALPLELGGEALASWLRDVVVAPSQPPFSRNRSGQPNASLDLENLVKAALFYQAVDHTNNTLLCNDGVRRLDQSWRIRSENTEEAILVGRLAPRQGPADEVTKDAVSPSRLWLGALPAPETNHPELIGAMRQETFVRVFIPVLPK